MRELLIRRFAPVLSSRAAQLFAVLLAQVERFAAADDGAVVCCFPEDAGEWTILPPLVEPSSLGPGAVKRWAALAARIEAHAPPDYARFLAISVGMEWGEVGCTGQLTLGSGFSGTLDCVGSDALDEDSCGFAYSPSIFSPIDIDLGDFYLIHPRTNALCFYTEGVLAEVVDSVDPVEIYLREMHHELKDVRVDSPFRNAFRDAPHRSAWLRDCA